MLKSQLQNYFLQHYSNEDNTILLEACSEYKFLVQNFQCLNLNCMENYAQTDLSH